MKLATMRHLLASTIAATVVMSGAAWAEAYRIVAGDQLRVSLSAQSASTDIVVDIDGQIRLIDAGAIPVAGKTLDEVEQLLSARLSDEGLLIDPRVSVNLQSYAPIIVAGQVAQSGSYPFLPGMTVGAALAVAGGNQLTGISRLDVERGKLENQAQMEILNLELAARAARAARLEAQLADRAEVVIEERLATTVPQPGAVNLKGLVSGEQDILSGYRFRRDELLASWANEIDAIETQIELFDQRLAVQEEVLASVAKDLDAAQKLQERGLQTADRLLSAQQREANARADVLALQSSRVAATQAVANAQRARTQFLLTQSNDARNTLQAERVAMDDLQLRYARAVGFLSLLGGGNIGTLLSSEAIVMRYDIVSPRESRQDLEPVTLDTSLLPGETLVVTAAPAVPTISN